jgi:hypothetical protein
MLIRIDSIHGARMQLAERVRLGEDMAEKIGVSAWGECLVERSIRDPWPLKAHLEALGLEVVPLAGKDYCHFVSLDHTPKHLEMVSAVKSVKTKTLVVFEPKAVHPLQHRVETRILYDNVLLQSARQKLLANEQVLQWGNLSDSIHFKPQTLEPEPKLIESIVFLNENKFSFVRGSQYKLRVLALRHIAAAGYSVVVGGRNWDRSLLWSLLAQLVVLFRQLKVAQDISLSNWTPFRLGRNANVQVVGPVEDGHRFLGSGTLALVIENDPDYVSEKLINALVAGAIPIYVGPDLDPTNIPESLIVRSEPNPKDIVEAINRLAPTDLRKKGIEISTWIREPLNTNPWTQSYCIESLAREISTFVCQADRE